MPADTTELTHRQSSSVHRDRAITGLMVVALMVWLAGPRATPVLTFMFLAALMAAAQPRLTIIANLAVPPPLWPAIALSGWAFISIAWAADQWRGLEKASLLLVFCLAVWVSAMALAHLDAARRRRLVQACMVAAGLGLAYLCFEEVTNRALKQALFTAVPELRPRNPRHILLGPDGHTVTHVVPYVSNRNMAALCLVLWPMLLIAWLGLRRTVRGPVVAALIIAATLSVALSVHETSKLALALSTVVLVVAWWSPRAAVTLVAAGWIAATLLVVPLSSWAYGSAQLHHAAWLPLSARQRVIIWGHHAEQVKKRPILGVGVASTKPLDRQRSRTNRAPPDPIYDWRTGPHAHNVFLQTWYELGAVGAALLCAFGLMVIGAIARYGGLATPICLATYAAAATIASSSWGMWQAWFLGCFAMTFMLASLAAALSRDGGDLDKSTT